MPQLITNSGNKELIQVARGHHGWHYEWRVYDSKNPNNYKVTASFFLSDSEALMENENPLEQDTELSEEEGTVGMTRQMQDFYNARQYEIEQELAILKTLKLKKGSN